MIDQVLEMSRAGMKRWEIAKALGVHERKVKEMRTRLVMEGKIKRASGGGSKKIGDDYELRCVDSRGRDLYLEALKKVCGKREKVQ